MHIKSQARVCIYKKSRFAIIQRVLYRHKTWKKKYHHTKINLQSYTIIEKDGKIPKLLRKNEKSFNKEITLKILCKNWNSLNKAKKKVQMG